MDTRDWKETWIFFIVIATSDANDNRRRSRIMLDYERGRYYRDNNLENRFSKWKT